MQWNEDGTWSPEASVTQRVVVFRPGALGDTILTADALATLRERLPFATVEIVGNEPAADLLRRAGLIDVARSFDHEWVTGILLRPPQLPELWREATLVIAWVRDPAPFREAFANSRAKLLVAAPEPSASGVHMSDYLVSSIQEGLGTTPTHRTPALLTRAIAFRAMADQRESVVLIHPGSGSPRKNWSPERFRELIKRLGGRSAEIRLIEGPADRAPLDAFESQYPRLRPKDLQELVEWLARAALYVGNDSGVTHLSARLGVPTVAIFGPTDPRRWAPRGPRVRVVGHPEWPSVDEVLAAAAVVRS